MAEGVCPTDGVPTVRRETVEVEAGDPVMGKVFNGRYRIERLLGEGGFGKVYAATQVSMQREVALKVLHPSMAADKKQLKRFYREARAASALTSPHVVRMYDFGVDEETGTPFIVMEYLHGRTLSDLIRAEAPVPPRRAARISAQVAQALADAGAHGVVHRDLKPDNIFLMATEAMGDFVKVVDFGIAKVSDDSGAQESLTGTEMVIGTPRYMAPEQVICEPVDYRTDLYALGCILHELLTGAPVFDDRDKTALMMRHVTTPAPRLPDPLPVGGSAPQALQVVHEALLAKKLQDRPGSPATVAAILGAVEHQRPIDARALLAASRVQGLKGDVSLRETVAADESTWAPERDPGAVRRTDLRATTRDAVMPPPGLPEPGSAASTRDMGAAAMVRSSSATLPSAAAREPTPPAMRVAPQAPEPTTDGSSAGLATAERKALRRALHGPSRGLRIAAAVLVAVAAVTTTIVLAWPVVESPEEPAGDKPSPSRTVVAPTSAPASEPRALSPTPRFAAAAPATAPIVEQAGGEQVARQAPENSWARLRVDSVPPGARVMRGAVEICTTPCDERVEPSDKPIALRVAKGDRRAELTVLLTPGADVHRRVELEAARPAAKEARKERRKVSKAQERLPAGPAAEEPVPAKPPAPARRLRRIRTDEVEEPAAAKRRLRGIHRGGD